MDVVALAQFGVDYAVASLGTSTTSDHMHLLFRTTPEVVCCYDNDNTGREATWRALENALPSLQDGKICVSYFCHKSMIRMALFANLVRQLLNKNWIMRNRMPTFCLNV